MQMISINRSIGWEAEQSGRGVVKRDAIPDVVHGTKAKARDRNPELQLGVTVQLGGHHPRVLSVVNWHHELRVGRNFILVTPPGERGQ
jgi:hypothetical protein